MPKFFDDTKKSWEPKTFLTFFLLIFFIVLISPTQTQAARVSSIAPANLMNGLIGLWTFDGANMKNNVADTSGLGNNGRLVGFGATSTVVVPGKIGQALMFDGIDDYVSLPDIDNSMTNKVSISAWIYPYPANAGATYMSVVGSRTNNGFMSFIRSNTFFWDTRTNIGRVFLPAGTISNYKWQLITGTYDGSFMRWYINGVNVYTSEQTGNILTANTSGFIGYSGNGLEYFHGMIDDVRIYNRTLSGAEAKQLYNLGSTNINDTQANGGSDTLKNGLLGWWTLDGANLKTNVADSSGSGKHARMISFAATSTVVTAGKIGQALSFDGVDDHVESTSIDSSGITALTYSFWIKAPYNRNQLSVPLDWGGYKFCRFGGQNGYYLNCAVDGGSSGSAMISVSILDNKWHHIIYTSTANAQTIYLDGVQMHTASETLDTAHSGVVELGAFTSGNNSQNYLTGALDDVRIYNRVLSTAEIKQLYNLGSTKVNTASAVNSVGGTIKSGLIGWWTFDGANLKNNITDSSGANNNGYFYGFGATSTAVTPGRLGQALKFNGTTNYISAPITSVPTNFTITTWFKLNELGREQHIAEFSSTQLYVSSGNTLGTPAWGTAYGNTTLKRGVWYFAAVVKSGTDQILYLNGAQDGTGTSAGGASSPFVIGDLYNHAGNYKFNGSIDDVRAYNRVLSAAEIKQIYNQGM